MKSTRTALVTGASLGIGCAIAKHLAAEGLGSGALCLLSAGLGDVVAALPVSGATLAEPGCSH
jgi:NAD(P)-dependent dehydrogenase (short-subunit alcohol dehydrogenase family)